ncbi:YegS/Rv2252/BmrU family lipid kinase [Haloferula luteola]|uniref:YegS/Rv2252/BmrU family lipid kinase n=1 Tax=Haloferula luteola TaxID=595692 RepID=A0A840VAH8_9BACT|nr:diacylglycerol kinase family protein [Haloferula luteola]MBB5351688.1 YegS/Rv2252/BmrU family lipid kinase [Haloferula luteola]
MSTLPRILVIFNPTAGQDPAEKVRPALVQALDDGGFEYEIRETQGEGDARRWARETECDRVLVSGGDGTIMEAMSGLIENPRDVPLAQLPSGTANLLARALAIPIDREDALQLALHDGVAVSMDVGHLIDHDRYFALMAGSGWDADLIKAADRELKNRLGFFAYVISGLKSLFSLTRSRIQLTVDDQTFRFRAHTVIAINVGEIHGSGVALGSNLSPHDGKLDLAIVSPNSLAGILRVVFRLLTRRYDGATELRYFKAERIRVEAHPPLNLEIDGEPIGTTPFEAHVVPGGTQLIVPRDYAQAKGLLPKA